MTPNRNTSTVPPTGAVCTSATAFIVALLVPLALAAPSSAQPFAYVVGQPNVEGGTAVVSVIDTATNGIAASIAVGASCRLCVNTDGMAIAPDIGRLYVSNDFAQTISVIDLASNTVVGAVPMAGGPTAIVASPNGTRIYVLHGSPASVSAIDTATNALVTTTPLSVLQARGMAVTPDGSRLYVSTLSNTVKVIATATMTVSATLPVGANPLGMDVSPDGSRVYVAAYSSSAVNVINTATHAVSAIPVGSGPLSARVSPDGSRVYVANDLSSTLSVIATQTNTVVNTLPVVSNPRTVDFTPDGTRVYVANGTNVQVVNTASNTVTAMIPFVTATNGYPASIAMGRAVGGNPPTAVNDGFMTAINTARNVPAPGVLANDQTNGGGAMTAQLVGNVSHGALTLNADGSFTYTPSAGFAGADSFTYRAVNSAGMSNLATVALSVVSGPQPPTGFYVSSVFGNTVTLRWTPPAVGDAPTGYVLKGGVSPGEVLASIATNSTAPVFTFVAPTGSFYIRMHTVSGGIESAASEEIRLIVGVPALPSTPASLLGVANGSTISLAWRNTYEGAAPTDLILHVTGSLGATLLLPVVDSVTVAGVPPGTYTLNLQAANASGGSALSNSVTLTFPAVCTGVPAPPTNFVAARDGSLITVLWERATSGPAATGFIVNVTGAFVGSFPTTLRSLSGAVGPGAYTISVQATNMCGNSAPTLPQTVIVP